MAMFRCDVSQKIDLSVIFSSETVQKSAWDDTNTYICTQGTMENIPNGATFTATKDCTVKAYFSFVAANSFKESYINASDGCEIVDKLYDNDTRKEYIIRVPKGKTVDVFAAGSGYKSYNLGFLCNDIF